MSISPQDFIENYQGGTMITRGRPVRLHRALVTYKSVELECEYTVDGSYVPATSDEPECYPCALLRTVQVGGQHIKAMLNEEQVADIEQRIERQWRGAL